MSEGSDDHADLDGKRADSKRRLVAATRRARSEGRRVVLVRGSQPIDHIPAVSGVDPVLELTADPATIEN